MFTACLHCNRTLDANESIESFPIGRRIAFDPAKGRLWAVCRHCERWNLSPIEERWEAIEQCERLFRSTRARVSTDNIGLARLHDGMDLVRIGAPLRPELAAWRYGDQFGRRRRKMVIAGAGGVVALGAAVAGGAALGVSMLTVIPLLHAVNVVGIASMAAQQSAQLVALPDGRMINPFGTPRFVARPDVPEGWGIALGYAREFDPRNPVQPRSAVRRFLERNSKQQIGEVRLRGDDASSVLRWAMPRVNRGGASQNVVRDGVALLEAGGSPEHFGTWAATQLRTWSTQQAVGDSGDMRYIPAPARLAFEMALHEETERRALEGELAALEAAWRDADEIARIADGLLLTPIVQSKLEAMKEERREIR